jgi:putative intracellular protease/amidase
MKSNQKIAIYLIFTILISFGLSVSIPADKSHQCDVKKPQPIIQSLIPAADVDILLLMDHEFGSSCTHIIERFEAYGWSVTIAGTNETLTPYYCAPDMTPDLILYDIDDVTEYDAVSIMPGHGHEILRTNETALDLIRAAVDADLIVSAWCRAVRVLAAADVLDGVNITGWIDCADEYIAAGAIFNEVVPPVTDGNIITSVRSMYYRFEMYEAIALALGAYESNAPEITNSVIVPETLQSTSTATITLTIAEDTGIEQVHMSIYSLDDTGVRSSDTPVVAMNLAPTNSDTYVGNFTILDDGFYTMDIVVEDVFRNVQNYTDFASIPVGVTSLDPLVLAIAGASITTLLIIVIVVVKFKRP